MNKKTILCFSLLKGDVINVSNSLKLCGLSNPAREIPRQVEKPFGVEVSRVKKETIDQYGNYCTYDDYRLNTSEHNLAGIEKMKAYVKKNMSSRAVPKTEEQAKIYRQTSMWLESL